MTQETTVASEDSPRFDPFRRKDMYGTVGSKPQPLVETIRLWAFTLLVLPLRSLAIFLAVIACYLVCLLGSFFPAHSSGSVAFFGKGLSWLCLVACGFFKIHWVEVAVKEGGEDDFAAIVSNHISWLDILVHMSRWFPSFVAKDGTRDMPMVGTISKMLGCIYVNRETKGADSNGVSSKVKERMIQSCKSKSRNNRLLLFPEGTTTNGEYMLPFKKGAFLAGLPVQPTILKYSSKWVSPAWESIPGLTHVRLLLCSPWHSVTIYVLPVYRPTEEEASDPELFAENVRRYMIKYSQLEPSDSFLEDKRQYHKLIRR